MEMTGAPHVLTDTERVDLKRLEGRIELAEWGHFGIAWPLRAIRDGRLDRETHERFEDYCRERWGLTRQTVNRYIKALGIAEELRAADLPAPRTEKQARPLGRLSADDRARVVRRVRREGGFKVISAGRVAELVERVVPSLGHADERRACPRHPWRSRHAVEPREGARASRPTGDGCEGRRDPDARPVRRHRRPAGDNRGGGERDSHRGGDGHASDGAVRGGVAERARRRAGARPAEHAGCGVMEPRGSSDAPRRARTGQAADCAYEAAIRDAARLGLGKDAPAPVHSSQGRLARPPAPTARAQPARHRLPDIPALE